jgi:hypothetical protein
MILRRSRVSCATTTSGVKVAQHPQGLKMGLTLIVAPGGGA